MTLQQYKELEKLQWKHVERGLSEILASYGEPPMYANRLNRLRVGSQPRSAELRALLEYSNNLIDTYID